MKNTTRRSRRHRNPKPKEKQQKPFFPLSKADAVQTKEDPAFFQPKLTIGQPGDRYEQEADKMADAVVSGGERSAVVQRREISDIQRQKEEVQAQVQDQEEEEVQAQVQDQEEEEVQMQPEEEEEEEVQMQPEEEEEEAVQMQEEEEEEIQAQTQEEEEEEEAVQMQEEEEEELQPKAEAGSGKSVAGSGKSVAGSGKSVAGPALSSRVKDASGKGRSLPKNTRSEMEASFGVDFGDVRIHTDREAAMLNKKLGAQAFTYGKDVFFNEGKFNPENAAGRHLLAHELTHVIQQSEEIKPKIQTYTVPAHLPCEEVVPWLDSNSPYAPGWAQTSSDYSFNGNLRISAPEDVEGGVSLTVTGHPGLSVSVSITIDGPVWNPSPRPNRAAKVAAWQSMMSQLNTHEQEHRTIGEQWRAILESRFQGVNFSVVGTDQEDAMRQVREQLAGMTSGWAAEAQAAQDAIDPFNGATLSCPAPLPLPPESKQ